MLRRALGLRARLLLALLATATVTLAVAALALLSPLRDQLRDAEAESITQAALATRPQLQDTLTRERRAGPATIETLERLARRISAQVLLFDSAPAVDPQPLYRSRIDDIRTDDVYAVHTFGRTVESESDDEGTRIAVPLSRRGDVVPYILAVRKPVEEPGAAFDTVRDAFTTAALVSLAVALALGLALSGALVRRLNRLRRSAQRLTVEGPDAVLPVDRSQDEIGDLSRAFSAMQTALKRQEEARRAFVATASHELRTPITSLSGNLELLAEDMDSGSVDLEDARGQIAGAQSQLRRLRLLATELLELSRLDAGVELHPEPVELGELCRAVAAEFALHADELGVRLDVVVPRAPVWARLDPGAGARVLRILIDNALRFAPRGTAVGVAPAYRGEIATLDVTDAGPGVPAQEREAIFERFRRGTRTGGEGGFGLGLAIGRELAERMDGALVLSEPGAKPGARFVLELPIALPAEL